MITAARPYAGSATPPPPRLPRLTPPLWLIAPRSLYLLGFALLAADRDYDPRHPQRPAPLQAAATQGAGHNDLAPRPDAGPEAARLLGMLGAQGG